MAHIGESALFYRINRRIRHIGQPICLENTHAKKRLRNVARQRGRAGTVQKRLVKAGVGPRAAVAQFFHHRIIRNPHRNRRRHHETLNIAPLRRHIL